MLRGFRKNFVEAMDLGQRSAAVVEMRKNPRVERTRQLEPLLRPIGGAQKRGKREEPRHGRGRTLTVMLRRWQSPTRPNCHCPTETRPKISQGYSVLVALLARNLALGSAQPRTMAVAGGR